jgi:uncharacterized phosphosugar-binding protein
MISKSYYDEVQKTLSAIIDTQSEKITNAAYPISKCIINDGLIYIFGCGHSHLIAGDSFYRAGGLACVSAMFDTDLMLHNGAVKSSAMERMGGIASHIFDRYCITQKDVLIVVSTSGINSVPVEMAYCAKKSGVLAIGITSSAYFKQRPRHSSGKLLYECVDLYIDNCVPFGDASIEINGTGMKMGSVSTAASSFIINSVLIEAAQRAATVGSIPPIYKSGNVPGGAEYNVELIKRYRARIKHL